MSADWGSGARRVDIGFAVSLPISVRLSEDGYKALREALADDGAERWHTLDAVDAQIAIDLSKVVYVRLDTQEQHVGFSSS